MSPLQTQYPLSPRKFWKKMIGSIIWNTILFLLLVPGLLLMGGILQTSIAHIVAEIFGLFCFLVLYVLLKAWYVRVYIRRYYYDAGDNFVTIKKGVFAPAEIHVMYQKIQDVYVDQDILDRIMGLYDVHLASATATSGMEAHIDGIEHEAAEAIKNLLLSRIQSGGVAAQGAHKHVDAQAVPAVVTLKEDVSSKTYPLSGAWLTQQIVMWFFSSVFVSGFITLYIFTEWNKSTTYAPANAPQLPWLPIWIGLFVVVYFFHIVYTFLWKSTYSFSFLPEYIQMKSGVISRSDVHVPYRAVQDVTVTQGIIERMFGLSTVNIENAAQGQMVGKQFKKTGVQIPGQPLEKANHIAEIVRTVTLTKNTGQTGL